MIQIGDDKYDSIIVTLKKSDNAQIVTADDNQAVIAVISDENIILHNDYEVKLVETTAATISR